MNLIAALPYLNPVYVHQPVAFILHKFLKRHKIAISREVLSEKLAKHPFHPSLLSLSDVLDDLGLAHQAARIDFSLLMERKEIPALIHLSIGEGAFGVILNLNEDAIKVLMEQGEERTFSKEQFLNAWNGIFLTLEANVTPVATISKLNYMNLLNLEKETLTKEQMKRVLGGSEVPGGGDGSPGEPSGSGGSDGIGGSGYKCCWRGTSNCRRCVPEATNSWTCVSGAVLTSC